MTQKSKLFNNYFLGMILIIPLSGFASNIDKLCGATKVLNYNNDADVFAESFECNINLNSAFSNYGDDLEKMESLVRDYVKVVKESQSRETNIVSKEDKKIKGEIREALYALQRKLDQTHDKENDLTINQKLEQLRPTIVKLKEFGKKDSLSTQERIERDQLSADYLSQMKEILNETDSGKEVVSCYENFKADKSLMILDEEGNMTQSLPKAPIIINTLPKDEQAKWANKAGAFGFELLSEKNDEKNNKYALKATLLLEIDENNMLDNLITIGHEMKHACDLNKTAMNKIEMQKKVISCQNDKGIDALKKITTDIETERREACKDLTQYYSSDNKIKDEVIKAIEETYHSDLVGASSEYISRMLSTYCQSDFLEKSGKKELYESSERKFREAIASCSEQPRKTRETILSELITHRFEMELFEDIVEKDNSYCSYPSLSPIHLGRQFSTMAQQYKTFEHALENGTFPQLVGYAYTSYAGGGLNLEHIADSVDNKDKKVERLRFRTRDEYYFNYNDPSDSKNNTFNLNEAFLDDLKQYDSEHPEHIPFMPQNN